jgi:hypothetical protein
MRFSFTTADELMRSINQIISSQFTTADQLVRYLKVGHVREQLLAKD